MKNYYLKTLLLTVLLGAGQQVTAQQLVLSEDWTGTGGQNAVFNHITTKTDASNNIYVAGSTLDGNNKLDIILQKFDPEGTLQWEETFNGDADSNDVAADIFIDNSSNIYLTGSSIDNSTDGYDLVVLKYNSSGTLQWEYYYDNAGSPDPYDGGAAITGDNSGYVYITGGSASASDLMDYITVKLNASDGSEEWTSRYDYTGLNDIAANISVSGSLVTVSGGSQVSGGPPEWEIATLNYNTSDGSVNSSNRSSGSAIEGVDEIMDMTKDASGNIYLTGRTSNVSTGYDISIYKLDQNLDLQWEEYIDGYGEDDCGNGIKVDGSGNVYVAGYVTTSDQGKNYKVLKYNSSGSYLWDREFNGRANEDDEATQLILSGNVVGVTGSMVNNSSADFMTIVLNTSGRVVSQMQYEGEYGMDDKPISIARDTDGSVIIAGQVGKPGGFEAKTVKYDVFLKNMTSYEENDSTSYVENSLIVRFESSGINLDAIDNKSKIAGELSDFVNSNVIDSLDNKLNISSGSLETYKVFRRMTSADSLSITRLGDTIRVPKLWSTLLVYFPKNEDLDEMSDSLNKMKRTVLYAQKDYVINKHAVPDDPKYSTDQSGLNSIVHGIGVEDAWDIQVGNINTKVGVFDSGVDHWHEDLESQTNTGIGKGWDYATGSGADPSFQASPDNDGHGTAVAGVIAADRNNNTGVSGIAGGPDGHGAQIYNMRTGTENGYFSLVSIIADAITEGAMGSPNLYGESLHIQNHSNGTNNAFPDTYYESSYTHNLPLLREAVKLAYKNECAFVASSGNIGGQNNVSPSAYVYPATYHDRWVTKVGANDNSGIRASSYSVYGKAIDFIAPGSGDIYATIDHDDVSGYSYNSSGTSIAAPHVSGAFALLHGEHHTSNGYPNLLAPEDMEYMLEKYATDVQASGYDDFSGHGRIHVFNSLEKITMPEYFIKHFKVDNYNSSTKIFDDVLMETVELSNGIPTGLYRGDKYKVTFAYSESLPTNQHIIDEWVRYGSSEGVDTSIVTIDDFVYMYFSPTVNQNSISGIAHTYCWYITEDGLGNPVNKWYPAPPEDLKFAYSVQVHDMDYAELEEQNNDFGLTVYPNPSNSILNIRYDNSENSRLSLTMVDITGKVIKENDFGQVSSGQSIYTINITDLANGIYFCNFRVGDQSITKQIVKQ